MVDESFVNNCNGMDVGLAAATKSGSSKLSTNRRGWGWKSGPCDATRAARCVPRKPKAFSIDFGLVKRASRIGAPFIRDADSASRRETSWPERADGGWRIRMSANDGNGSAMQSE